MVGFAPVATAGILVALGLLCGGLRVDEEAEVESLDLSEHSESAYGLGSGATIAPEAAAHAMSFAAAMVAHRERERLA